MPTINDIRRVAAGGKAARRWRSLYPPRLAPGEVESEADAAIRAAWVEWWVARLGVRVRRLNAVIGAVDRGLEQYCTETGQTYTVEGRMAAAIEVMSMESAIDFMDDAAIAAVAAIVVPEEVARLLSSKVWIKNPPMAAGACVRTKAAPGDGAGPGTPPVPGSAASTSTSTPRAGGGKSAPLSDPSDEECPVCFDYAKVRVLPCMHLFCNECAKKLMATKQLCPICQDKDGITGVVWLKA